MFNLGFYAYTLKYLHAYIIWSFSAFSFDFEFVFFFIFASKTVAILTENLVKWLYELYPHKDLVEKIF